MSLYYDAAPFLVSAQDQSGSLKSRVFNSKSLKSLPKQVYALVAETSKWSSILSGVIDNSQLLQYERKLSPGLALVLVHDLLLSKSGIAAPKSHPLRVAITRHKARLGAELTKIRIKTGFRTIEDLRTHLECSDRSPIVSSPSELTKSVQSNKQLPHPRWVRINTIRTTLGEQLGTTYLDYAKTDSLSKVLLAHNDSKVLYVDKHIPDLIALPAGTDLTRTAAYCDGLIILQDKASCFPAYLLDPQPEDGTCLDACAAPGNKTTHLAAILRRRCKDDRKARIWACERDKFRAETLTRMVNLAGCEDIITVAAGQDFLLLDPEKSPWKDVGSLLLDPSCSGSGIIGRDVTVPVTLPGRGTKIDAHAKSRKRKRGRKIDAKRIPNEDVENEHEDAKLPYSPDGSMQLSTRLEALSAFQLRLLLHAFRFPSAKRISYSTCSVYAEENEHVVITALRSPMAKLHHWRLLTRDEQVAGMQSWSIRGDIYACHKATGKESTVADEIAEACIRCHAGTEEGTQGFFVAAFIRDHISREDPFSESLNGKVSAEGSGDLGTEEADDEWEGLSEAS
ncbi:MAG: hypothetical protein Q9225_007300 [Loekoesia sp. 1 TL-2023]